MDRKVLIIEDETGIRTLLKKIIEKNEGFTVVGECDNKCDAIKLFNELDPDVVFLDVELNGESGICCAKELAAINKKAKLIFATAHSEYMANAFEVYAFDYLVKPFNLARVNLTLDKIRSMGEVEKDEGIEKIIRHEKGLNKIIVKSKESISFIDVKDIILVQREENNTVIYTDNDSFITSAKLGDVEEKLDNQQFLRSHKSYIINISKISKIFPYGRWTYIVKFKDIQKDALITQEKYEYIKSLF